MLAALRAVSSVHEQVTTNDEADWEALGRSLGGAVALLRSAGRAVADRVTLDSYGIWVSELARRNAAMSSLSFELSDHQLQDLRVTTHCAALLPLSSCLKQGACSG